MAAGRIDVQYDADAVQGLYITDFVLRDAEVKAGYVVLNLE